MNAGTDRDKALQHAYANAKADGAPRYVHQWNGTWWIEKDPPTLAWAGVFPENVYEVRRTGEYTELTITKGATHGNLDRPGDQASGGAG